MLAIASLLAVVAVSLLITRVATMILVASGMSRESARFQARSAFTGAGFTTTESEDVVRHPVRRRVVMTLMLLGNAGIVAAASGLILGFRGGASGAGLMKVLALVAGLLTIVFVSRSALVDRRLTLWISRALERWSDLPERGTGTLLELPADRVVAEVAVGKDGWAAGGAPAELSTAGVTVLAVQRADGRFEDDLAAAAPAAAGDVLIVYATAEALRALERRATDAATPR